MELVVLGAHGTWPLKGGATSGYLLRHDGFDAWVDMGTGTMAKLQEHVELLDVDAVVISHAHPDHFVDLYPYFYARLFDPGQPTGLPLYTPPRFLEHAGRLISESGSEKMERVFEVHTVEPGETFELGPFRVRTAPMRHPVPTLGMRIESDGQVLAYSADTGPTDELVGLARDADVLVSEATWLEAPAGQEPLHLSPREAGDHARRAGVERLVVTHVWPTIDLRRVEDQASETFDGPVSLADEGMRIEL